jgi:TolB-like protein
VGLFAELKRRNVIRMALLYCVASWVVLQVADVLFGIMGVPDWSLRLVFGILLLGLPIALIFSWVFELTPEGLRRERPAEENVTRSPDTGRKMDLTITALLVVAVALLLLERVLPRQEAVIPEAPVASVPTDEMAGPSEAPRAAGAADPRSVAVLPFVNMSGDADNEYFSDGLTEELLNVLARMEGLKVAARTSSFHFKGQSGNMGEIARQLGVAHLLEGSVRRSGDRVRVTAQLINPADGFHLWSETYDRQLTDIFAIQDDIAAEVARALRVRLLGDVAPAVPRPPTGNMEAYTAYLRGKQALRIDSYEAFERADAAFREALSLDPGFAAAHAALAETWRRRAFWGVVPWKEAAEEVRRGVARALELEPEQPLAWALDGELKLADETEPSFTARLDAAERSLRRALELEPGQPQASEALAFVLRQRGRDEEGLRVLLAALERDPLSARVHGAIGDHYRLLGELEQAAMRYQAAAELAPADPLTASRLTRTRYAQGRIGEAIVLASRQLPLDPRDHEGPLGMVQFYLELGLTDAALPWVEAAERMAPEATTTRLFRALWHWRRGEHDEAAAISAAALEAGLPDRWASRLKFGLMVGMHEQAQGRYERSLAMQLNQAPTALDPLEPDEPVDTEAFLQKVNAVPLIRLRDGEAAARARATELLAHLERQDPGLADGITGAARLTLYGILGRSEEAIAEVRALDRGAYAVDEWFWSEADLSAWDAPDAPVVQAYLAEKEAIRERERAWLAQPGRKPDPEMVLAAMARAAAATPEHVMPAEAGPDPVPGPR